MRLDATVLARHIRPLSPIPTDEASDLERLRTFKGILFDVYGTLLISAAGEIDAGDRMAAREAILRPLLLRYGINLPAQGVAEALPQAIQRAHVHSRRKGVDHPEVDILAIWQQVLDADETSVIEAMALEYELMVNPVDAMPGARELLKACQAARIPMGIISNAQCYTAPIMEWLFNASLEDLGFDPRLLFFSWLEQHAKPSPVMFERARARLSAMDIPATAVIHVGNDMRNDVEPANRTGFQTALFAGDRRSLRRRDAEQASRMVTPTVVITDLRQLIAGIDSD